MTRICVTTHRYLLIMARLRVYDVAEQDFRKVVANSLSLRQIIRTLQLHDHTNTYKRLRRRIEDLALDTSHFRSCGQRRASYSPEQLRDAVKNSRSLRQTLIALGLRAEGGNYRTVRRAIDTLEIDTSHFTGQGWRKDSTRPMTPPRPLKEVLVENSEATTSHVRRRLLQEGLVEQQCAICGIREWMGKPLTIELDHVNGIHNDHRLENIRMLCPNCHSQTPTYRGRNRRRPETRTPTQLCIL